MSLLRWAPGSKDRKDIEKRALHDFTCTEPRRKVRRFGHYEKVHDAPHELRVQSMIRQSLTPYGDPRRTTLLGWSADERLGGVVSYRQVPNASAMKIDVIAISMEYRGRGGGWAREALNTALDYIEADADGDGYSLVTIGATIHENNRPSQRLFEAAGFEQTDVEPEGYQTWSLELLIGADLFD